MCNRFENAEGIAIYQKITDEIWEEIHKHTDYTNLNVSPTNLLPVLDNLNGYNVSEREWGYWFENGKFPYFNIQTETLLKNKELRNKFEQSKAIVGATAFFEWQNIDIGKKKPLKVPLRFFLPDYPEFFFPCITNEYNGVKCFTILTIAPNKYMSEYHSRMPVIFTPEKAKEFLNERSENLIDYCVALTDEVIMSNTHAKHIYSKEAKAYFQKTEAK